MFDRKDGSTTDEIGLIAEEVHEIIPEVTFRNKEGLIEGYNKADLVPYLIKEIQKLKKEIDNLKRVQ